jgi:hypothetical protein
MRIATTATKVQHVEHAEQDGFIDVPEELWDA